MPHKRLTNKFVLQWPIHKNNFKNSSGECDLKYKGLCKESNITSARLMTAMLSEPFSAFPGHTKAPERAARISNNNSTKVKTLIEEDYSDQEYGFYGDARMNLKNDDTPIIAKESESKAVMAVVTGFRVIVITFLFITVFL